MLNNSRAALPYVSPSILRFAREDSTYDYDWIQSELANFGY
jgi:hypothetical protein